MGDKEPGTLDQALEAWAKGDHLAGLRGAVAVLEAHPADPLALFLSAYLGGKLGEAAAFSDGLRAAAERAVDLGNLPLAVAIAGFARELELDASALYDAAAAAYARDSARIKRQAPPALPTPGPTTKALASSLDKAAVVARAAKAVRASAEHLLTLPGGEAPLPAAPLFSSLDRAALRTFVEIFEPKLFGTNVKIVEEGAPGGEAFVVARGEVDVSRHALRSSGPVHLARLGSGALVGEMALLSRAPRTATVTTASPVVLLVANKRDLDAAVTKNPELGREFAVYCRRRMLDNLIRTSPILHSVNPAERSDLVKRFVIRAFEPGERLITQGRPADGLFLVASGEVTVVHQETKDKTVMARLGPGEVLGEVALVLRRPANADVVASHPTVTLLLPRERFLDAVRAHPGVFVDLYELASRRDEETSGVERLETADLDDSVLI
ncbi:MAG TPA: cyclic nucleotide-binding domain-containing protein [Polyangiaceae bacterium]|nr:cyclic nucleotide-binding domain-containing protein [Polyangiaceae bacterium]